MSISLIQLIIMFFLDKGQDRKSLPVQSDNFTTDVRASQPAENMQTQKNTDTRHSGTFAGDYQPTNNQFAENFAAPRSGDSGNNSNDYQRINSQFTEDVAASRSRDSGNNSSGYHRTNSQIAENVAAPRSHASGDNSNDYHRTNSQFAENVAASRSRDSGNSSGDYQRTNSISVASSHAQRRTDNYQRNNSHVAAYEASWSRNETKAELTSGRGDWINSLQHEPDKEEIAWNRRNSERQLSVSQEWGDEIQQLKYRENYLKTMQVC